MKSDLVESVMVLFAPDERSIQKSKILVEEQEGGLYGLPRGLICEDENSSEKANDILKKYTGIDPGDWLRLKQIGVADHPDRFSDIASLKLYRLYSIVYAGIISSPTRLKKGMWVNLDEALKKKKFYMDHEDIIRHAGQNV